MHSHGTHSAGGRRGQRRPPSHPEAHDRHRSEEQVNIMRRFVRDESGMTLGLAMVMILLIGVMGAGLLTFAGKDLDTVVEVNRGQRAFELADAGVGVAKRQITAHCVGNASCTGSYDASMTEDFAPEDIQWSWRKGGVTLDRKSTRLNSSH